MRVSKSVVTEDGVSHAVFHRSMFAGNRLSDGKRAETSSTMPQHSAEMDEQLTWVMLTRRASAAPAGESV